MFGRRKPEATPAEATDEVHDPTTGKGHATPSRREAQQARKQQLHIPKDPKQARKAARERERADRDRQRAGMMAGDPRYLPARDQGAARAFARDFVDSRFTFTEYFVFIAIAVLILGFIPDRNVQAWVSLGFFVFTGLILVDLIVLLVALASAARKMFPDKAQRKGLIMYGALRVLQIRKLRLPAPRVRRGGKPIA